MSSNSTLYYTAVEDMLQDMVHLEDAESENPPKSEIETYTHTPKRSVRIRQHNLFSQDSSEFVINRRLPKPLSKCPRTRILEREQSPQTHKDFQGLNLLRLRQKKSESDQMQDSHRRLTMRI